MDSLNSNQDIWLTTREAADIIGCGERKLLRLIESGEIEAHKDERSYLVSLTSARAYRQSEMNSKGKRHANGEGSVYESPKGSGKWKVAITVKVDGKNKRIRRNASSQKDALKRKKELEHEFGQDRKADSDETKQEKQAIEIPTIKELCDEWLESISRAKKENTLLGYKNALQRWVLPTIGDKRVNEPTTRSIQELFNDLSERYASNTVHRAHTPLKMAFDYAVSVQEYITKNVVAQVNLPAVDATPSGIRLKVKELRAILRVADEYSQGVLIYFMTIFGTRLCEGLGTYTKDFDLEEQTIAINQQLQALGGSHLKLKTPKTPSGIRLFPVPRRMSALLQAQLNNTVQQRKMANGQAPDTKLLFLSKEGTPLWPRNVERMFASIVERAGLAEIYPAPPRQELSAVEASTDTPKRSKYKPKTCAVCPQDLRRTALTLLGDLGVDESTKALIAGHGPKNVTMRYDRGTLERMRDALQKLEDLILGEGE